jgi:cell division protein FtsN
MSTSKPNLNRFFAFILISILILSVFPSLPGQFNDFDSTKGITSSDDNINVPNQLSSVEVDYWSKITGLESMPEENLEKYYSDLTFEFGPELTFKRTLNSKSYIGDDNLVTVQIYSGNIHFKNAQGGLEEYNTEIKEYNQVPIGSGIKYEFSNEANTIQTYFRKGYSESGTVLTQIGDDYLTWEPIGMAYSNLAGEELNFILASNGEAVTKNNKLVYPGTYPDTADVFTITENKLKHEVILDSLPSTTDLEPAAEPSGLVLSGNLMISEDLNLYLNDEPVHLGETIKTEQPLEIRTIDRSNSLELPTPIAYELNNPTERVNCKYIVERSEEKNWLKLSIETPYDWLVEPSRTFPVVIDPTIAGAQVFSSSPPESLSNDTWIGDNSGALVDDNFGKDDYLLVGGDNLQYRALLKFDLSSLPANDIEFESAMLKLTPQDRSGQPQYDSELFREVAVHEVVEAWKEGTGTGAVPTTDGATWNSNGYSTWSGGAGGTFTTNEENRSLVGNSDEAKFELNFLVDKWNKNPSTNLGLIVKYYSPSTASSLYKAFYSSKTGSAVKRPKLDVTYRNDKPAYTNMVEIVWDEDTEESTRLFMDDVFYDPNNDPLTIKIWNGTAWTNKFRTSIFNATLVGKGTISEPWICEFELLSNMNGNQPITFNATDRIAYTERTITVRITPINDPPVLKRIGTQSAVEEQYLYLPLEAVEVEGQPVKWDTNVSDHEEDNYMENIFIEPNTKDPYKPTLIYYPKNSDVPMVYLNVSVRDSKHTSFIPSIDWEHFIIYVENVNDKPLLTKIDGAPVYENELLINAEQGKKKLILFQAYDDDIINGDDLTFSSDAKEGEDGDNFTLVELSGADIPIQYRNLINTEIAQVEWTPENKHVGEYIINVTVEDQNEGSDLVKLRFKVKNSNDPPIIKAKTPISGGIYNNRDYINFTCIIDDPDLYVDDATEELNVTWYSNISSLIGYGRNIRNVQLKAGFHKIEVLVKDSEDAELREYIFLTVEKSITLQKYAAQGYDDYPDFDDIEYSYNDKTKKFTISQGRYEEVDVINLSGNYQDGKLVIDLEFASEIELMKEFQIRIFIVMPEHNEPEPDYKLSYTSNFFQKGLYQPPENVTYGYFTQSDGVLSGEIFTIRYSLADLEVGNGQFEPLSANFKIFATVRWQEVEYYKGYKVENYRYDSIGYGAAIAPAPPRPTSDGDSEDTLLSMELIAVIVAIIVILIIVFVFMSLKKKKAKKTVIDFSQAGATSRVAPQGPEQIQQMFMSPLEQQFRGAPGTGPGMPMQMQPPGPGAGPGMSGRMSGMTTAPSTSPIGPGQQMQPTVAGTGQPQLTPRPSVSPGQQPTPTQPRQAPAPTQPRQAPAPMQPRQVPQPQPQVAPKKPQP